MPFPSKVPKLRNRSDGPQLCIVLRRSVALERGDVDLALRQVLVGSVPLRDPMIDFLQTSTVDEAVIGIIRHRLEWMAAAVVEVTIPVETKPLLLPGPTALALVDFGSDALRFAQPRRLPVWLHGRNAPPDLARCGQSAGQLALQASGPCCVRRKRRNDVFKDLDNLVKDAIHGSATGNQQCNG